MSVSISVAMLSTPLKMKFITLLPETQVYHGSVRLYQITCYIRRNQEALIEYLKGDLTSDVSDVDPSVYTELTKLYTKYKKPLYLKNPVSKEVLYIATMLLLLSKNNKNISVYRVWNEFFKRSNGFNTSMSEDQDVSLLLDFALDVEGELGLEAFNLMFYSSMRLPVQFFSPDYATSEQYALDVIDTPKGEVYTYTLTSPVSLLDYDDEETVQELSETVYASKIPYSLEDITYYTYSRNILDARASIMKVSMVSLYDWDQLIECLNEVCGLKASKHLHYLDRPNKEEVINVMAKNWFIFFKHELITPHHLWRFTTWMKGIRVLSYDGDALLLKVLIENGSYSGYYSEIRNEMAIIDPGAYGVMNTDEVETRDGDCPY